MILTHNMNLLITSNKLIKNEKNTSKSMEKISSGLKIMSAADSPGGNSISNSLKAQIRGLAKAQSNVQDGIHLSRAMSSSLDSISDNSLNRLRELSLYAQNDTSSDDDKEVAQGEVEQILKDINNIAENTEFNGIKLLSEPSKSLSLQVGANSDDVLKIKLFDVRTDALGISEIKLNPIEQARLALNKVDEAINKVSSYVTISGSCEEDLLYFSNHLMNYEQKITLSNSQIEDADMAKESLEFAKNNIIDQATQALYSQANHSNDSVIQLLK